MYKVLCLSIPRKFKRLLFNRVNNACSRARFFSRACTFVYDSVLSILSLLAFLLRGASASSVAIAPFAGVEVSPVNFRTFLSFSRTEDTSSTFRQRSCPSKLKKMVGSRFVHGWLLFCGLNKISSVRHKRLNSVVCSYQFQRMFIFYGC